MNTSQNIKSILSFQKTPFVLLIFSLILFQYKHQIASYIFLPEKILQPKIGSLQNIKGSTLLKTGVLDDFTPAIANVNFPSGARVWTKSDGEAIAVLNDGSKISISPNSIVEFSEAQTGSTSSSEIKMSIFKGQVQPIFVKSDFHVFAGGSVQLIHSTPAVPNANPVNGKTISDKGSDKTPVTVPTPISYPVIKSEPVQEVAFTPKKKIEYVLKSSSNQTDGILVSTNQTTGTLRVKIFDPSKQQVYLETQKAAQLNKFSVKDVAPGSYTYQVDWVNDSFETLSEKIYELQIQDLSPPKVRFQNEAPKIVSIGDEIGWKIYFNSEEEGLNFSLKVLCDKKTFILPESSQNKDSISFIWSNPEINQCKDVSTYQILSKSKRGVSKETEPRELFTTLDPPDVDLKSGIQFLSSVQFDHFLVEVSEDPDFNTILFRQRISSSEGFSFTANKQDVVYIRAKGEWHQNLSPFSVSKRLLRK